MFRPLYIGKSSDEKWLPQDNQDGKKKLRSICISQICLDPIQNRVSANSVQLEAAYIKALQ